MGRSHGGFPDFGYLDPYRPQAPYQLSGAQGGSLCPTALGPSTPGAPGYDHYGQFDSSFVYQQTRRGPFPHLATFDSQASLMIRGSEHNSPSKTYSRLSERDSRPPILSKSANTDRVESPPRDREPHLPVLADTSSRHVRDCGELPPSLVHVSNSGATSPSGGCSVSGLAGEVNVHVSVYRFPPFSLLYKAIQKLQSVQAAEVILIAPWWPKQSWFPQLLRLCVDHPLCFPYRRDLLSQQDQKYVLDGKSYHLHAWRLSCDTIKQQAFQTKSLGSPQPLGGPQPIACMTIGLSPQTVKGYRTCLGSVLNRTGNAKVVMHQTISDMIASMELQRHRVTLVLKQWDLGIVLGALSKPACDPLGEASFKHLILKTVFLLAMASAGRCSELQVLRFDQNYIQFKPKRAGVTLYFSPEFMRKNQKPNQVNDPWYIPAVPTGKSEFGAPNCPVRALRYYHRHLTEHQELRKDRRRPFVSIKDNNAGKELSASTISRWICTTIVDSHAAIQNSRNLFWICQSSRSKSGSYIVTAFQQGRSSFCHEGRKMVQWLYLHFLLP